MNRLRVRAKGKQGPQAGFTTYYAFFTWLAKSGISIKNSGHCQEDGWNSWER